MAKTALSILKTWFETGDKPTQQQLWNWLDSFFHKDDTIPAASINSSELQSVIDDRISQFGGGGIASVETIVVSSTGTYAASANELLSGFILIATATGAVKIGTTAGAGDIWDDTMTNTEVVIADLMRWVTSSQTIHFTGDFIVKFKVENYA